MNPCKIILTKQTPRYKIITATNARKGITMNTNININVNMNNTTTKTNTSRIKSKHVKCNEDGKVFDSVLAAGKYYKVHPQNICHVLNGRRNHTGGLSFCYIDSDGNPISVEKSIKADNRKRTKKITIQKEAVVSAEGKRDSRNCEPCVCITEGKIFSSMSDAADKYECSVSQISYACADPENHTAAGKQFCTLKDMKLFAEIFCDAITKANAYDIIMEKDRMRKEIIAKVDACQENVFTIEMKLCEANKALEQARIELANFN